MAYAERAGLRARSLRTPARPEAPVAQAPYCHTRGSGSAPRPDDPADGGRLAPVSLLRASDSRAIDQLAVPSRSVPAHRAFAPRRPAGSASPPTASQARTPWPESHGALDLSH